ncbi:TonB-dependent receptor domain-containing protein [Pseudidiomarina insulisalsae]|uniref:TonB-dependent receptor n=1 Tax=Pseudidiomarina insulisalsae TaxID=575789 RepID=A0A432YQ52_9GAMM|nr:TonB-dependent receptor [Pseudidiomarina insulisalsae]RUO63094.1 TonB-dependent receptor [Pseudidiomarina insulisalsae]
MLLALPFLFLLLDIMNFNSSLLLRVSGFLAFGCVLVPSSTAQQVERVTVTGQHPYYHETLSRIFTQYDYDQANLVAPTHLNDLLTQSPLISLNGQGGQLQNISIRGFSRWRIQSLIDGVPILSDRRAGASVDFIPPSFISSVAVIPGAASTYLGSGAIGGAVNLRMKEPFGHQLQVGWNSNQGGQDYSYTGFHRNTDWKVAYRNAGNGKDANGRALFDQYEQTAFFVRHRPEKAGLKEAWTLYSDSQDVGKSSSDFPQSKITTYPTNRHWLGKLNFAFDNVLASDNGAAVTGNLWWHQSQLDSNTLRPGRRINQSSNQALNFGADMGSKAQLAQWQMNWQLQLNGRENVVIDERELTLAAQEVYRVQSLTADELGLAGVVDTSRRIGNVALAAGVRLDWLRQENKGQHSTNTNISGFAGANYAFTPHWSANLYISSAYRNPTLTERFFSGETPRGTVRGDVNLATEQAMNLQGGVAYNSTQFSGDISVFYQRIDNYIERVSLSNDLLQYANLDRATVKGATYHFSWQPRHSHFNFALSGAWVRGVDEEGNTVADIPANTQRMELTYQFDAMRLFSTLQYRADKTRSAAGERALESVFLVDAGASWQLTEHTVLSTSIRNVTDELYYVSADEQAAFAHGRSVQLNLSMAL